MSWSPAEILIASAPGMVGSRQGYVWRGLGIHMVHGASPKGHRPPVWLLTHLGSGHAVCRITGHVAKAFPIASEIADLTDWSFDGVNGWRNTDPDLAAKFRNLIARYPKNVSVGSGLANDHDTARLIAMARA